MNTYQLLKDVMDGTIVVTKATSIKRLSDNAFIPFDPANTDYQEYLKWVAEGNEPLPPDSQE
jgi:hypothetical protein